MTLPSACSECDFIYAEHKPDQLADEIFAVAGQYPQVLLGDEVMARLRKRPSPDVWSPLEYACHVRDVLRVQAERVQLALTQDTPSFAPMGREERVINDKYNAQDPQRVAEEILAAAARVSEVLELGPREWQRTAVYNYPEAHVVTIEWIGQNCLHELRHHLIDITE